MSAPASADSSNLRPAPLALADIGAALRFGMAQFRAIPLLSMAFATLFVVIGAALFALLEFGQIAPMSLSLAGGFMLVGPVLLAGFFAVSDKLRRGRHPVFGDIWAGFRSMPRGGWVISFVCGLLFLIWITDAGILYGFMVGREPIGFLRLLHIEDMVLSYAGYSAIMGGVLAFILFAVSAFSIPLIYDHRATLVSGVVASVRTVFGRFGVMMCWALLLAAVIMVSVMALPLLLASLPVMAYASRELYFRAFPASITPPPQT
ncbi:DUF2189 domain-containing protein [Thauera sp.]|jgi:uncharacterized membrane protein|uniref:DUF2189 domain-containing protein n=1 Tax=Thauera sp. TaxID=1905334 RepID=UPI00261B8853|nr:DUF2189 domain-containing protein [Thauera sp.]MCK6408018.1 DUF2189 domain-containing protein [Thauera sp.]